MNLSIKEINELIYSLGIAAHNGNFCNREVNESLLEKLYYTLNERIAEEAIDEEVEDYISTLEQDSDRYESSVSKDYDNHLSNLRERGYVTQVLLDYVDRRGAVCYSELHAYYKIITGSNSFSHVLQSLTTPYKNRKTQRYLAKEGKRYSDAKYVVKVANPSNWVIVND